MNVYTNNSTLGNRGYLHVPWTLNPESTLTFGTRCFQTSPQNTYKSRGRWGSDDSVVQMYAKSVNFFSACRCPQDSIHCRAGDKEPVGAMTQVNVR